MSTEAIAVNGIDPLADWETIRRLEATVAELKEDVARLNTEVGDAHTQLQEVRAEGEREVARVQAELTTSRAHNRQIEDAHIADIDRIGAVLMEEAESRDWCEDYDRVIERLNRGLQKELPLRMRNHEVEIRVSYTWTVNVLATNQDDAEDIINNLDLSSNWSPSLPFYHDDVSSESSYAYNPEVEVV